MQEFELIAKTFQGLETVLATELIDLGANNIQIGRRMVSFTGNKELMYRANFQLRTAIRILKPIKHFQASTAEEVYNEVKQIDWSAYLNNETTFAVDSVVFSNDFRHSKFVAYKVKDAIVDQFREKTGERPNIRIVNPTIKLHIHIAEHDCTLSLDSSGESLHRRGYRQEAVEAPLNEVLAAGIIMLTGWHGECDLIDPMCGSGTFALEAALIARGISPGIFRQEFAFEKWPDFDKELLEHIYNDDSNEREFEHHIYAYDINRKAVEIASRNVKAAGLGKEITVAQQDFKDFTKPEEKSLIIMNPPYGERISSPDLLGLYKMIGERLKHQFQGNDAWILSYREECFDQIGLKPSLRTPLFNGSLECELRKYQLFDGKFNEMRAKGGDIKTAIERRMMAEKKRFKKNSAVSKKRGEENEDEAFSRFDNKARSRKFAAQDGYKRREFSREEGFAENKKDRKWGESSFKGRGREDRNGRNSYKKDERRGDSFRREKNFRDDSFERKSRPAQKDFGRRNEFKRGSERNTYRENQFNKNKR